MNSNSVGILKPKRNGGIELSLSSINFSNYLFSMFSHNDRASPARTHAAKGFRRMPPNTPGVVVYPRACPCYPFELRVVANQTLSFDYLTDFFKYGFDVSFGKTDLP